MTKEAFLENSGYMSTQIVPVIPLRTGTPAKNVSRPSTPARLMSHTASPARKPQEIWYESTPKQANNAADIPNPSTPTKGNVELLDEPEIPNKEALPAEAVQTEPSTVNASADIAITKSAPSLLNSIYVNGIHQFLQ